jgi:hypothetical protein
MKIFVGTARALQVPGKFKCFWKSRSGRTICVFLSETHLGNVKAKILKRKLGCGHFFIHESDGRSGGLLMLWRKETVIQCQCITIFY